jgi:hypothetical protein
MYSGGAARAPSVLVSEACREKQKVLSELPPSVWCPPNVLALLRSGLWRFSERSSRWKRSNKPSKKKELKLLVVGFHSRRIKKSLVHLQFIQVSDGFYLWSDSAENLPYWSGGFREISRHHHRALFMPLQLSEMIHRGACLATFII